jgi:uncharacterized repeat protein (TIGR01451 family)
MMVLALSWNPPVPRTGDQVTFTVTYTNIGPKATPQGTVTDTLFSVIDNTGTTVPDSAGGRTWSDVYTTSIPSGGVVTLTANGGGGPNNQSFWVAGDPGNYTVQVLVNGNNRFTEMDRANNTRVFNLTVLSAGPATAPAAPVLSLEAVGDASVALQWTVPSNGGSPITTYQVYRNAVFIATNADTTFTDTGGLANGTSYTYTVTAVNAVGEGPVSNQLVATPSPPQAATQPDAPTNVLASSGNATAQVTWLAPYDGGSPITSYRVTPFIGTTAQAFVTVTGNPPTTTANLTGLTNGTAYTFKVTAINALGSSVFSASSNTVTPAATVPSAPTLTTATAGNAQVALAWTAPTNNGGSAITSYNVYRSWSGTSAGIAVGNVTSYTDGGLTNGTSYTYQITAFNAVGESPRSNAIVVQPTAPGTAPNLPANQIVGQASYKTLVWGGSGYIYSFSGQFPKWKTWGFYGNNSGDPGYHVGNTMVGNGQLPSDTPNHAGSQYDWQRAQEGLASPANSNLTQRGSFYNQKFRDPEYESYFKHYTNFGNNTGVYPPMLDWWDDAGWAAAATMWGTFGRDLKNVLGGSGIGFDTEPANWDALAPGHTNAEQAQKIFDRAYQCGTAYYQNFPDGKEFSYMWNGIQGGYGQWLRGWYYNGDNRLGTSNLGSQASWYFGWLKAMCDFGSVNSRVTHMQADFYSLGEGGGAMTSQSGDPNSYNNRLAKLKLHCEGIMASMSQPFPLGLGTASWSKGCDRMLFVPAAWASGYSTNPRMSPTAWNVMMPCDREGSMGAFKCTYTGGGSEAGGLADTPDGQWYAVAGNSTTAVQGYGTTHNAGCLAGADKTPISTVAPTCINMSWTGSTVSCQAAHKYGVIYVKVYNGQGFNPNSPEVNYLGAMSMVHTHPSLPFYVGIPGNAPGGSNVGASAPSVARMADSYQQCTFTQSGTAGQWLVLKVVSAKLDVGWFSVQHS